MSVNVFEKHLGNKITFSNRAILCGELKVIGSKVIFCSPWTLIGRFWLLAMSVCAVFIPSIFFWGGEGTPQINLQSPQAAAKLCALDFFGRDMHELQIYHGNFLIMDNKHRKLFVIKQSVRCTFVPEMHQSTFGGRTLPGPAGGAYVLPQTP